ncbi:hypothetical protein D3C86_1951260 [compost metagenome]
MSLMAATSSIERLPKKAGPTEPMKGMCAAAETLEILRSKAMSCGLRSNSKLEMAAAIGSPPGVSYSWV